MPALITASACTLALTGAIDASMVDRVHKINCVSPLISLSSLGGEASDAFHLLDALREVNARLEIRDVCASACAEVILPFYRNVVIGPGTLITVHGNPIMKRFLARHYNPPGIEYCKFAWADRLEGEYRQANLNKNFWQWQLRVMPLKEFIVQSDAGKAKCPSMTMSFAYDGIAVTRKQLLDYLGIDIKVNTCAEKEGCISNKERNLGIKLLAVN